MSPSTSTSVCSPLPSSGSRLAPVPHLRRYYGVVRLLPTHPGRLRSPSTARYLPMGRGVCSPGQRIPAGRGQALLVSGGARCLSLSRGGGRSPRFLGNPCERVPRARDSGGSQRPRITVVRMLSFARLTASTSATANVFGAEPSRPASSLPTLRPRQSPGERQGSLPACPLRLWPGWTFTSWIPLRGFGQPTGRPPLPGLAWRDSLVFHRQKLT